MIHTCIIHTFWSMILGTSEMLTERYTCKFSYFAILFSEIGSNLSSLSSSLQRLSKWAPCWSRTELLESSSNNLPDN